jgi:hypothetical protein
MPFYKLLRKTDGFQWDDQAMAAFIELKQYLSPCQHWFQQEKMMCCCCMSQPPTQSSVQLSPLNDQRLILKSRSSQYTLSVKF